MPNSPPPPRAAPTSARRQLTWCRYPMQEFTLKFKPRTPLPRPGFRAALAGFSLCRGGGARLSVNGSEAEGAEVGTGAGLAAGRRICQTGLDRPTATPPPPERPGLATHRRSGGAPASPRELLREHGALLTFRAGGRGLDVPDPDPDPPPAERLREKGQMLMFSSEPAPLEWECPPCFRFPAPSLRFSLSLSRSFSSAPGAGFLEKMSVQRLDPPPPPPVAVGRAVEVIEAGGGETVARRNASPGSGSGSATGTHWLMPLPMLLDAGFGVRTGSGRSTPPAKSSSAQEGEAAGLGWSGQNSNSGEEDALLLLLASAASMAA
jgi:hypothetical protein|uniref:Uncharacterized protein n=1 Tax=Zea mays TaxID=4577 RepID=A0A804NLE5_MAIZE